MGDASLMHWNDQVQKGAPRRLRLVWKITAAKTVAAKPANTIALTAFDAISAQATIDDFLGSTTEFNYLAFDATAMGNDAFAAVVNLNGQCKELIGMTATCYSSTGGSTQVVRQALASSTLTASTLATECAKGADGNVAFKVDFGNTPDFDGLTSGTIVVELDWISK